MITLTVAIPSYGRDAVLVDSLTALLALDPPPWELLLVDQTPHHDPATEAQLSAWQREGCLRWLRLPQPSITGAMNRALQEARGERVLFLDDDILPDPDLLEAHERAGCAHPEAMVAGRILQPWHQGVPDPEGAPFLFNSLEPLNLNEFMGGNVSLPRKEALALGGFDTNFVRVAYRFEAEFAQRWRQAGLAILYAPDALIHHLKAERGGTRSYGEHLTTLRPDHAVGRYYFRLRTQPLGNALAGSCSDLLRSVRTRHHLRHPWWMPLTLLAEARGLLWALRLHHRGPGLLPTRRPRVLIASSHPVKYHTPLFQYLAKDPGLAYEVLYLSLPTPETQGLGFGVPFTWDLPLLSGYPWREAATGRGRGINSGYSGVRLRNPFRELGSGEPGQRPDALLLTGWHFLGLLQLFLAARLRGIPVILRMDSNGFRPRPLPLAAAYFLLIRWVTLGLPVGTANERWYRSYGFPADRLIPSPHYVDNAFFAHHAEFQRSKRADLRAAWHIPPDSFCFLFAGKLQSKKHLPDLLEALRRLRERPVAHSIHLLVVGTGPLEAECISFARQHQLPVSFAGFLNQSQMPQAYVACDCLVLPSDHGETWGLVVNEAMACGLPAIVSDQVGCAEDLVEDGSTGMRFPCADIEALAHCLERMSGDPHAALLMGDRARELVHRTFTIEKAAAGIKQGVVRVMATRRGSTMH